MTDIDVKTIERIRKLLALARDGGATEHEAATAMERAQAILQANNLSMAEIEMSGGAAQEARLKERDKGKANYRWQRWLMTAICEANYVYVAPIIEKKRNRFGYRDFTTGYDLIGKVSNIASTRVMYEYMLQTVSRMRFDYEAQPGNGAKEGALFAEGLAYRLSERIKDRHRDQLAAQKREAEAKMKAQAARASHPGAAPTGNALVVVMADYSQREEDLNNDMRMGYAPGTTEAKRKAREAKEQARDAKYKELKAAGVDDTVAYLVAHLDWTQERAAEYIKRQASSKDKEYKSRYRGGKTREDRLNERLYTGAAGEGRRAAESVSLDRQVGNNNSTRRIK